MYNLKEPPQPLSQSKYILAKYGIQVIEPQFDPLQETIVTAEPHSDYEDIHYHPGPRAIEYKANAGKFSCDRDSWMRILWCFLFPCTMIEECLTNCCDCCWEYATSSLRRMEEHYTFQCCDYCCKLQEN